MKVKKLLYITSFICTLTTSLISVNVYSGIKDVKVPGSGGGGSVDSVFGRTGVITAQSGDYTKSDVGLGNVENTALSTWIGTANLTTLGTIVTGTWNGTAIGDSYISSASTWNAKQNALGFTPENSANKAQANGYASLNASSKVVQDPANATTTPGAGKIPIADSNGLLDAWVTPGGGISNITSIPNRSHTDLQDIGSNNHTQIDSFISSKATASGLASLDSNSLVVQNPVNATSTPTANKIPIADGNGKLDGWVTGGAGAINSVFGRTGTVTAQSNDYTWAQVNKATSSIADITTRSHTSLTDIGTNTHAQVDTFISSKASASGIASLDSNSLVVQNPANGTATPTANKIPIADSNGKLDSWITGGAGTSTPTANKLSIADSNGKLDSWITAGSTLAGAASIQKIAHKWTAGASHTGNTTETSVHSWAMPGGTVVAGDIVRITSYLTYSNNSNLKTFRVKFGTKTYTDIDYTTTGAARYQTDIIIRGTTSQLTVQSLANSNGGWSTSSSNNTSTENTANSVTIDFTWELGNGSDTATLEAVTIEVL